MLRASYEADPTDPVVRMCSSIDIHLIYKTTSHSTLCIGVGGPLSWQTAAALVWVNFQLDRPRVGLEWINRLREGSPLRTALETLDWTETESLDDTDNVTDHEFYDLSDDPESERAARHVAGAGGSVDLFKDMLGTWCVDCDCYGFMIVLH